MSTSGSIALQKLAIRLHLTFGSIVGRCVYKKNWCCLRDSVKVEKNKQQDAWHGRQVVQSTKH